MMSSFARPSVLRPVLTEPCVAPTSGSSDCIVVGVYFFNTPRASHSSHFNATGQCLSSRKDMSRATLSKMAPTKWTRSKALAFIDVLQQYPCPWNVKCKEYKRCGIPNSERQCGHSALHSDCHLPHPALREAQCRRGFKPAVPNSDVCRS